MREEDLPVFVKRSEIAFKKRSKLSIAERVRYIEDFLKKYTQQKKHIAELISKEIGKPITQAL